jgi:hypothetical protein
MLFKRITIAILLLFSVFGLSNISYAKEVKKDMNQVLSEVDAKVQAALDVIPSGNNQNVVAAIKEITETAGELSANYKFEFERDKVVGKVRKAREAAQKSDLATAEQELKAAKEGFANLKKYL